MPDTVFLIEMRSVLNQASLLVSGIIKIGTNSFLSFYRKGSRGVRFNFYLSR